MPRRSAMREELKETGIITGENGEERGRLTLNGLLILNEAEMFFEIYRHVSEHGGTCPVTVLNRAFSLTGTWGYDAAVNTSLLEMGECGIIGYDADEQRRIFRAWPLVTPRQMLKKVIPYTTRNDVLAGLEPIEKE